MASGTRKRVPCSSVRASPRHTLRSAVSLRHLHSTCSHRTTDLVSHHAHLSLTAIPLPHDLPMIVSLVHAQQQQTDLPSQRVWASLGSVVSSVIRPVVGETVSPGT